ncbi:MULTISPECIES: fluoride efflux transporter CrcB [unclassified Luteococcus]|uniref:fluoride efflux transporter CrcB n=1 Tax=unclassified Luteococcus TaxID=2639923 RepID=UPI00313BA397
MNLVLMAVCGGLGAVARFVLDATVRARHAGPFPWGTLLVNVVGSFFLGLLTAAVLRSGVDPGLKLVLGTGFCGGFTTFSTASVEVVRLVQNRRAGLALTYLLGGATACLAAAWLGFWLP